MKKMFKTAASLAVGCALLSTSAFAALEGSVVKTETGATVSLTGYAEKAQSTILVLKDVSELSADLADSAIAYINQAEATDGSIAYDVKVSGDGTYTVFVGGSDQTEAKNLGSFVISSVVPVETVTLVADKTTLEIGDTATITATVLPDDATDKTLKWSENVDADGATATFTATEAGTFTVTAESANGKVGEIEITVNPAASSSRPKGDVVGTVIGEINLDDASAVLQIALKVGTWTAEEMAAADVTGSVEGEVNLDDASAVLQKALKVEVDFKN